MKLEKLKDKKIIIIGYGIEGKSTMQFLNYYFPEKIIDFTDQKEGNNYLRKLKDYDLAIKSPGIKGENITIPYTTASNIFFANVKGKTIGVTGSKGKSTTSSIIFSILKQSCKKVHLVGNITHKLDPIGSPMLTELMKTNSTDDIWVCELSSFMLSDIKYSPYISVMINFFPEHMDYHGDVKNYLSAKSRIIANVSSSDFFVYNPNFPEVAQIASQTSAKAIPFIQNLPFSDKISPFTGKHNLENIKAAVTVAEILEIKEQDIISGIKNTVPLPHRLEKVDTFKGITFYDDAISTTPQSTIEAIKSLENIGTIFLGGQDRGYDFSELAEWIIKKNIFNQVLFPDSGDKIYHEIKNRSKNKYNILRTDNMEEAVKFAYKYTPEGSICLLSTASPSYSIWENFEVKGKLFNEAVKKYSNT